MQVIRQYHPGVNIKRMITPDGTHRISKQFDVSREQVVSPTIRQIDGEKVSAAWMPQAFVVWHEVMRSIS